MQVETLYPPDRDAHTNSRSGLLFLRLIAIMRVVSYVLLIIFSLSFIVSLFAMFGSDSVRAQLFEGMSPTSSLISSLTMIIGTVAFLVILSQLSKICLTLVQGDPFVPQNADRLRTIWVAVALAEILRLGAAFMMSWLHNRTGDGETMLSLDLRIYVWFLVLALIVLTEVFREGARLRQEQKLTI